MIQGSVMRWAIVALFFGSGCMPFEPRPPVKPPRGPRATLADMTARHRAGVDTAVGAAVQRLPNTPAGQLRRGWLLIQTGQAKRAVHIANRLIYDPAGQPAHVRSLAFYLRGRAFRRQGDMTRAREDLHKARSLAASPRLRSRCQVELAAMGPDQQQLRQPASNAARPGSHSPRPAIVPRRSWNASRPIASRLNRMRGIRKLTIHHSANISRSTRRQVVATQIRSIQHYHISQNRWGDIGYHFLIDPAGRIWQGRSIDYQGAHAGGDNNRNNVGICLLGKFTGGGQKPSADQVRAMTDLVRWLRTEYEIPTLAILTHREIKSETICPGSRLQSIVNRMRRLLAANAGPAGRRMALAGR